MDFPVHFVSLISVILLLIQFILVMPDYNCKLTYPSYHPSLSNVTPGLKLTCSTYPSHQGLLVFLSTAFVYQNRDQIFRVNRFFFIFSIFR